MTTIAALLTRLFTGPLIDTVLKTIETARARNLSEARLRTELQEAITQAITEVATTELQARRDILLAELRGESLLQRLWRPIVALTFAFILLFYALILPIAVDWFGLPPVRVGDTLLGWIMTSVNIALGGYIGGRTLEKMALGLRRRASP